ncbi:MAG: phage tail tape measure protein [Acidimicrobiales bacterium]
MELERIRLALEVDSAAWAAGLRGAATQLGGFGAQVDGIVGKITGVTSKLGAAGTAFGAFGAGMALAFAASIGPAIEFEQAFTGVLKTVNGSQAQLATVRDGILDMSRTMPIAATEIAGVAEAAGQLGVATGDILGFSETMIKLGVTTNLTAEQAATSLARFSNIMGTSTSDVDKLGATIAYLGNNFATTESEIVNWGLRLAGAGAVAGATEAEVLAIGAAMSSLGINAEMGATAISTVWMEMTKAVETGSPKLQTFAETAGMTSEAFASMFESTRRRH